MVVSTTKDGYYTWLRPDGYAVTHGFGRLSKNAELFCADGRGYVISSPMGDSHQCAMCCGGTLDISGDACELGIMKTFCCPIVCLTD